MSGPSEIGSTLKSKEFAPIGSKFFPFRVNPFSEGRLNNFDRIVSAESVSIPLNKTAVAYADQIQTGTLHI